VAYSNGLKTEFAGVTAELMESKGAVDAEVARALAGGIRQKTGAGLGLSITGIAGPGTLEGGDAGKPVGLVYIGLADGDDTQVKQFQIPGDRDRVRLWAAMHALEMLRHSLL
jgi:nicotinamide-nucleotide amidase